MSYLIRARLVSGGGQGGAIAALLAEQAGRDGGHKLVWSLMNKEGRDRDFLYRQVDDAPPAYLILSPRLPESAYDFWQVDARPFEPGIAESERLGFTLRVSPAIRHSGAGKPRPDGRKRSGPRHDVLMEAKRATAAQGGRTRPLGPDEIHEVAMDWLQRRGVRLGFRVDATATRVSAYAQARAPNRDDPKEPIRFSTLDYDGRLTVTDAAAFGAALLHGIGPQKSFGCGLMLVKRL